MIDRDHALSVTKQAEAAGLARSTVITCRARRRLPISASCARSTGCIWSFPLRRRGCCAVFGCQGEQGRTASCQDADAADGHRGAVPASAHDEAGAGAQIYPYLLRGMEVCISNRDIQYFSDGK